jgi:transcriptional antiterminator RfaH
VLLAATRPLPLLRAYTIPADRTAWEVITLHWYALYTKPHKEQQVSSLLKSKGYEVYLPAVQVRRRGQEKTLPFFSCYLFARMNGTGDLSSVRWTPGLRSVVNFGGQPALVPDEVVSLTRERLARMQEFGYPLHGFKHGDRVQIKSGPFADYEALFDEDLSSRDRARILVDCLGRWTRCEVEIHSLKRLH